MSFVFMLIGAVIGAFLCASFFDSKPGMGFLFGAMVGLLFAGMRKLRERVTLLEHKIHRLSAPESAKSEQESKAPIEPRVPVMEPVATAVEPAEPYLKSIEPKISISQLETPLPELSAIPNGINETAPTEETVRPSQRWTAPAREPDAVSKAVDYLKRWFTEGNVPVKIGVLVLFGGIAALLKYAADQGWFSFPIEFRLIGVALAALAGLVFAWRKRGSHRAFALSLQGGAIGVLLLNVFAAFRLYHLLPAPAAFALLLFLVAGTGVLAVLQDALALAFLGIIGGFLAPVLVSSDSGNHVALFTYYAILNSAVLGIAWMKPWRILNLIGFAFTFAIGTLWGVLKYQPEMFASTEPFLILFFFFYLAIPILYALRQAPQRRGLVDGTLVFGTPLLAFPLQVGLLDGDRMAMAYSALGAALVYTALAWFLLRRLALRILGESFALLALGFATIAVPLALSARSTACTWALEGAGLVWLGLRQQRRLPRWIGYALQMLAGAAYVVSTQSYSDIDALPILNGALLGALLIALAGFVSARLLVRAVPNSLLASVLFVWAFGWWLFAGVNEIDRFAVWNQKSDWLLGFAAFTIWVTSELRLRWGWRECVWPVFGLLPLSLPMIPFIAHDNHGPLEGYAAAAWVVWLFAALRALVCLNAAAVARLSILHFLFLWVIALVLGTEFAHLSDEHFALAPIWSALAALAPLALLFWLGLKRSVIVRFPLDTAAEGHRPLLLGSWALVLGIAALCGLLAEGRATPLPYIPVFNPLELAQLLLLLLLLNWYRQASIEGTATLSAEQRARMLALLGFLLLTSITLRSVHFFTNAPWSEALFDSTIAQAGLSVVWSLAGIIAMVIGARRGSRGVWIGGASLMGVVIVKLILIDRHHLHDLPAILGTLAVGLLLLIVGYFAPVPPRRDKTQGSAQ